MLSQTTGECEQPDSTALVEVQGPIVCVGLSGLAVEGAPHPDGRVHDSSQGRVPQRHRSERLVHLPELREVSPLAENCKQESIVLGPGKVCNPSTQNYQCNLGLS